METPASSADMSHGARIATHNTVSAALARHTDAELTGLLAAARPLGSGIGGTSLLLDVGGVPVFVKRLPLTDLELRPENLHSTANLFGLPDHAHYGVGLIGGPGFGAWRELAAQQLTTDWVLEGDHEGFPLMYHWRVLPHPGQQLPDELADVDKAVDYWHGDAAIRRRIEGLRDASASVALFLEYIPRNLHDWLGERIAAGGETSEAACAMVEEQLPAGVAFMNSRGLLHLDAHFQNILTDGDRLYFGDFGLAVSSRFDLSEAEAAFVAANQDYDRCYAVTHLVLWLAVELYGYRGAEREVFLQAWADGKPAEGIPDHLAAILARHAPVAGVMSGFYRGFQTQSRRTPFPAAELAGVLGTD